MSFYPPFTAAKSEYTLKSAYDLAESLSHRIALEAVMRVLASKGRRISGFYGNSYVQSSNLLSLLNVPRDKSYTTEVSFEASLTIPTVCLQTTLLHMSSSGGHHRHGRMQGSRVWHELKLDDARDALTNRRVEILGATSNLQISVLGMFQHCLIPYVHPRFYSLHSMLEHCKTMGMPRMAYHPQPYVITDNGDPALHMWFLSYLIEGRAEAAMSYGQYLGHLKERVSASKRQLHSMLLSDRYIVIDPNHHSRHGALNLHSQ
ncbi:hypothetical protein B0O80DRAFT_428399 [Mortierella sp. GBAus27b]|nr:hypothetical protein B0O80DRAFT_428399 [Mortierella sp. GBAus27b]